MILRALDSFRDFLFLLEEKGLLKRFSFSLSPEFECSYLMRYYDGKDTLLFEDIEGFDDLKVVAGVYNTRQKIALGLGVSAKELLSKITNAIRCPGLEIEEVPFEEAPVHEIIAKGPVCELLNRLLTLIVSPGKYIALSGSISVIEK